MRATMRSTHALEVALGAGDKILCRFASINRVAGYGYIRRYTLTIPPCLHAQEVVPQNRRQASMARGEAPLLRKAKLKVAPPELPFVKSEPQPPFDPSVRSAIHASQQPNFRHRLVRYSYHISTFDQIR